MSDIPEQSTGCSRRPAQTVHIVDDDAASRIFLNIFLRGQGFSTALYETRSAFFQAVSRPLPGCVVFNVQVENGDGDSLHGQMQVIKSKISLPVIVTSRSGGIDIAVRAIKLGAVEFLPKPFQEAEVVAAVENALAISTRLTRMRAAAELVARLSLREKEVLDELVAGLATKQIAMRLQLSTRTVEVHRARMLRRLGVRNLAQAVELAVFGQAEPINP